MSSPPPYRTALLVVNPVSGRGAARRAALDLATGLRRSGVGVEVYESTGRGAVLEHLAHLAYRPELVVAIGGDGTLRETLEALPDPELPVAILPYGTANVLAKALGIPRDPAANLALILRGRTLVIDVARANGRLSFLMASVGLDARVVHELEARRCGPITKWSYVTASLRALRGYVPPRLEIEVDGRRLEGEHGLAIVANTHLYAGFVHLAHDARIDDGLLDVYVFPGGRPLALALALARGVCGEVRNGRVLCVRGKHIRVAAPDPAPYQIDGDLGGTTPLEIAVVPGRHRLVVP